MTLPFVDAHVHTLDMTERYADYSEARAVFSCCSSRDDWSRMKGEIRNVIRFYGIHPWNSDQWDTSAEEELRCILSDDPGAGIGEIGLDGVRGNISDQIPVFRRQLELSKDLARPVQIHMVRCEKEVLECLRDVKPGVPSMLHSFKNVSYVKPFAELGCFFSINPRIFSMSEEKIRKLLDGIPDDRLLVETDAPYLPKDFVGMGDYLSKLSTILGMDAKELALRTAENSKRFIQWE